MNTAIRFGQIHVLTKNRIQELRDQTRQAAGGSKEGASYSDALATLLNDPAVTDPNAVSCQALPLERRAYITNTGNPDLTNFKNYRENCMLDVTKRDERDSWVEMDWAEGFIQDQVAVGTTINIVR